MIKKMILCLSLYMCFFVGCGSQGKLEFVQVVQDHSELTAETNAAVIATIRDEMAELEAQGSLTDDARQGIEDLITRLQMGVTQAQVIKDYVNANDIDEDLLSRLIRARWQEGYENDTNSEDVVTDR